MQIVSEGLSFTYNKKTEFAATAIKNVSLSIDTGDFFGIIGQTGSGKSTFIQHLNGLIPVQEGKLIVGEYDLSKGKKTDKKILKNLRRDVGIVFQYPEYQLFAETVFEDVSFGLKNYFPELTKEEVASRVFRALTLVGLNYDEIKNKSPFDLSGGQKRRVAIAGVLVTKPKVLILDEPVAGLDPQMKKQLMDILHLIHKTEVDTIVIVSHDMDEVAENCNKVAVFVGGELQRVDSPKNLFKDEEYLKSLRLDVPVVSKLCNRLKSINIDIDSDINVDSFVCEIVKKYTKNAK